LGVRCLAGLLVCGAAALAVSVSSSPQEPAEPDVWAAFVPPVGGWQGEGSGFGAMSEP